LKRTSVLLMALALVSAAAPGSLYAAGEAESGQDIVAVVNEVRIPRSFWDRETMRFEDLFRRQGEALDDQGLDEVAGQALDTVINMELLYQESRRRGIEVSPQQVAEQVQGLRARFPSDEAFAAGLEQMGFAPAELEVELLRQLAVQLLIDSHIAPRVSVSEEELRGYYDENPEAFRTPEQVRARHILIRVAPDAGREEAGVARGKIEDIRRRIVEGADFAALARELSEDASAAEGGELGYFSRDRMVPGFSEAAFSLAPGTLSQPVRSEFGYHLIEVTERREAGVLPYGDVQAELRRYLHHERTMSALDRLVAELRETASIQMYPGGAPAQ